MPYSVSVGKRKDSCFRKKANAKKRAKALRKAGRRKVRVNKRKSCR